MGSVRKARIDAILGDDFNKLLDKLGVKEGFESGQYRCHVCGDQVGVSTVRIVFPLSEDEIGFVCQKSNCIAEYKLIARDE